MKTYRIVLAGLLMVIAGFQQPVLGNAGNNQEGKGYSFIRSFNVSGQVALDISTSGGNIRTEAGRDNTVEVAFIVARKGQVLDISADELKDYADVEISASTSSVMVHVNKIFERGVSIGFSIKTPVKTSASLRTSGGNIDLNGITGTQMVRTSGGNLHLEGLNGTVDAKTSGGNLHIADSKADFEAGTSGGNISVDNIDGHLNVSTSGGNIRATSISNGISARTSGGSINLSKVRNDVVASTSGGSIHLDEVSGSVKAGTSGGNIKANITKLSGMLELKTSGGSIQATIPGNLGLDLDLRGNAVRAELTNFSGVSKKDKVLGTMNGGGIPVNLSTSGGNISLDFQ